MKMLTKKEISFSTQGQRADLGPLQILTHTNEQKSQRCRTICMEFSSRISLGAGKYGKIEVMTHLKK